MSAKPDVRMSRDDIRAFVASQDIAFVCLRDAQGRLIAKPCRYKADDGDLVLASPPESENDAQACAIIDTYPSYDVASGRRRRAPFGGCGERVRFQQGSEAGRGLILRQRTPDAHWTEKH
jgi:hypothetical protein